MFTPAQLRFACELAELRRFLIDVAELVIEVSDHPGHIRIIAIFFIPDIIYCLHVLLLI